MDWLCVPVCFLVVFLVVVLLDVYYQRAGLRERVAAMGAKLRRLETALAVARHNLRSVARFRQAEVLGVREVHAFYIA